MLAAVAILAGLVVTNPGQADFERFAADQLVEEIAEELCQKADLPLLWRLAIGNCEQLVRHQRAALAAVVGQHTLRTNLAVVSVFRSEIGGQRLLDWRVPRFRSLVLGVAGTFLLIQAGQVDGGGDSSRFSSLQP